MNSKNLIVVFGILCAQQTYGATTNEYNCTVSTISRLQCKPPAPQPIPDQVNLAISLLCGKVLQFYCLGGHGPELTCMSDNDNIYPASDLDNYEVILPTLNSKRHYLCSYKKQHQNLVCEFEMTVSTPSMTERATLLPRLEPELELETENECVENHEHDVVDFMVNLDNASYICDSIDHDYLDCMNNDPNAQASDAPQMFKIIAPVVQGSGNQFYTCQPSGVDLVCYPEAPNPNNENVAQFNNVSCTCWPIECYCSSARTTKMPTPRVSRPSSVRVTTSVRSTRRPTIKVTRLPFPRFSNIPSARVTASAEPNTESCPHTKKPLCLCSA